MLCTLTVPLFFSLSGLCIAALAQATEIFHRSLSANAQTPQMMLVLKQNPKMKVTVLQNREEKPRYME